MDSCTRCARRRGGGSGGEFEAGEELDTHSAAELAGLDTFQQAEQGFPKWEEEQFGGPAGAWSQ